MFYDLRITQKNNLAEYFAAATELGYSYVAVEHITTSRIGPETDVTAELRKGIESGQVQVAPAIPLVSVLSPAHGQTRGSLHVLTRLTVQLHDKAQMHSFATGTKALSAFDVVAVSPATEDFFIRACESLDIDIISLDLSQRISYNFHPKRVQLAISRGIMFEICYAHALATDPNTVRCVISNIVQLVRATKGRNIIFSGSAASVFELRAPLDVANLGVVWGLKPEQAMAAVSENCRLALLHGETRRTHRGALKLV
mmetsp:Transcript_49823/g.125260  ORF Transcript_49823/g.125260 Transcript_49823/m.125260 type:complete len:256 (+) Transcript_49823:99-866(+)